jgi:hypothetical protein
VTNVAKLTFSIDLAHPLLLEILPGIEWIRVSALRTGNVYRPRLSIHQSDSVEIVEKGVWWIDRAAICKGKGYPKLWFNKADIDFFDLATEPYQINKFSVKIVDYGVVGLPSKRYPAKL